MIRKMRPLLARMTTQIVVEYSLVAAATIVALANIVVALIAHGQL